MNLQAKRQKEIKIVVSMIQLYCRHHDDIDEQELIQYATSRIENDQCMKDKTFCSRCKIHCYEKRCKKNKKSHAL